MIVHSGVCFVMLQRSFLTADTMMIPYPAPNAPGLRGSTLDRVSERRSDEAWVQSLYAHADWVPVWRYRSALHEGAAKFFRLDDFGSTPDRAILLGLRPDGRAVFCFDASNDSELSERHHFADLRGSLPILSTDDGALLGYARAMVYWHRQHRHCGRCGSKTETRSAGHVLYCTSCETEHYPRSDPSMLCLATNTADAALLGRKPEWPSTVFSVLAGFSEPGETLEDCVAREIWEESRIRIRATEYITSQPWPFPASVLFGYLAQAEDGTPQTEQDELAEAHWFSRDDIRNGLTNGTLQIPPPFTLSHFLIATWFDRGSTQPLSTFFSEKAAS